MLALLDVGTLTHGSSYLVCAFTRAVLSALKRESVSHRAYADYRYLLDHVTLEEVHATNGAENMKSSLAQETSGARFYAACQSYKVRRNDE